MRKKDIKIYAILAIVVIIIIIGIYLNKSSNPLAIDKDLIQCIADNSLVYSSSTCGACKYQKDLFGDSYDLINEIDCLYETEKCQEAQIKATPTWIINNQEYPGAKTIEELKELTGC